MKIIASSLLVLGLLAIQVSEANAVVCAAGAYHAGCAGAVGRASALRLRRRSRTVTAAPRSYGQPMASTGAFASTAEAPAKAEAKRRSMLSIEIAKNADRPSLKRPQTAGRFRYRP